ncbi:hypothetical protein AJ78_01223 [Emergomyces pasteurianus Ep9510]|uniref:Myb-like domain-containing protein n=1 Tax=Emergomyces pasteurianus Ep9510 TaxID=1447872 RepID=A0A1J9PQL1_9EURO|nr:hypothetical protein AJ78_01223 [Emergomyces pasteurianus Ep9510]
MLLPSALSCDSRQYQYPTRSRFATSRLFPSTPPASDDGFIAGNGLLGTCRALQSLLNTSPAPSPQRSAGAGAGIAKPAQQRLQSPLHVVRPQPGAVRAQKVVKKQPQRVLPTRGIRKRRRDVYEDDDVSDRENAGRDGFGLALGLGFSTPKRRRRAPEELPLGLMRADFRSLEMLHEAEAEEEEEEELLSSQSRSRSRSLALSFSQSLSPEATRRRRKSCNGTDGRCRYDDGEISRLGDGGDDGGKEEGEDVPSSSATPRGPHSDWTSEDDKRLVELVLEKLKLSKRDWNECARKMGKDNDSVGRRWKALVGEGNVGLRRGRRVARSRIHESWRCDR